MLCPAAGIEHSKKASELLCRRILWVWRHNTKLDIRSFNEFPTIWDRVLYLRAVYNWVDDPNFPANYGVALIIPTPDPKFSVTLYMVDDNHIWIGKIYYEELLIVWNSIQILPIQSEPG